MDKKGFTLVELLAVIAILAILVIIAMPNVLQMFNKAKQDAFETEVKAHVKAVSNQFITTGKLVYSNVVDGAAKLPMDGEELDYYIELDTKGNIKELNVTNGDYKIEATGTSQNPIKVEQIGDTIKSDIAESGEEFAMGSDGSITNGKNNFYNKKFIVVGGDVYFKISEDNKFSYYDSSNNNLLLSSNVSINENILTISNIGEYSGKYKLSSDGHRVLVKSVSNLPENYILAIEEGYCSHGLYNEDDRIFHDIKIVNNYPEFYCGTCGKKMNNIEYEIIDGVLYTYNMYVGNGWELNDIETYNINAYAALIWDKSLEEVHIRSAINGKPVKLLSGYQRWTDDSDLNAKTLILDMYTKAEWIEHDNYMKMYADSQNREYLLKLEKVVCKDGTINY